MPYRAGHPTVLETFRGEWIRGHLDYQRAADALEAARRANQDVEKAGRHLAEIEASLARQFDRFCGVGE